MRAVVLGARELVADRVSDGGWIPTHQGFPRLDTFDGSGLPWVTHTSGDVACYRRLFGVEAGRLSPFGFKDVPAFDSLIGFAHEHQRLRQRFGRATTDRRHGSILDDMFDIAVAVRVLELLDRVIHMHGLDFDEAALLVSYVELEHGLIDDQLSAEIWVPIALTPFEDDELLLDDHASVQRIPDDLQLARIPSSNFGGTVHDCVLSAATHALVLPGCPLPNGNVWSTRAPRLARDPPEQVGRFFGAVRLATGLDTGWAQIFLRPVGWAHGFTAHLPPIESAGLGRMYPSWWDEGAWTRKRFAVNQPQALEIRQLYNDLAEAPRQLRLALRRLNSAMLRDDEQDAVVDLLIALEAAIGEPSSTELIHKLSLRVAAIAAKTTSCDAVATFKKMKKIYDYRSAIVHGGDPAKKRCVRDANGKESPLFPIAIDLVRTVLVALLRHPVWRDPAVIDADLLLHSGEPRAAEKQSAATTT